MQKISRRLTTKERKTIEGVLSGTKDVNSAASQEILQRPHVAVAFNTILDRNNLTDEKLAKRAADIITRKAIDRKDADNNVVSSNITTVDANALQAIRTIWQVKGKFTDKHEILHSGNIANLPDTELDRIIAQGVDFLGDKIQGRINATPGLDGTTKSDSTESK